MVFRRNTPSFSVFNIKNELNMIKGTGWIEKNGDFYYYEDWNMKSGWIKYDNKWYFTEEDGKMRTGWIQYKGNWYYLNSDGSMAKNTTVNGFYFNEEGIWTSTPEEQKS
ncbi:hypothetical protein KYD98_11770 [Clostridium sp. YB-6]|uniref:Cell wall-binding protein n=2 Tax=Clostridium weizhouense TaxID=2859781 RepID=A0ABS7AQU4_9CLOT|nr:hypothetical protein [Clostridium weizhouense]